MASLQHVANVVFVGKHLCCWLRVQLTMKPCHTRFYSFTICHSRMNLVVTIFSYSSLYWCGFCCIDCKVVKYYGVNLLNIIGFNCDIYIYRPLTSDILHFSRIVPKKIREVTWKNLRLPIPWYCRKKIFTPPKPFSIVLKMKRVRIKCNSLDCVMLIKIFLKQFLCWKCGV